MQVEEFPDNIFGNEKSNNGLRTNLTDKEKIFILIENDLSDNFTLCIKHNGYLHYS